MKILLLHTNKLVGLERYPHEMFYLIDNDEYKNITSNNSYLKNKIEEYATI